MSTIRHAAGAALLAVLAASPTVAGNLLTNRDFDVDLSGWWSIGQWDPADATCLPDSGSVRWTNTSPSTSGAMFLHQCVELPPGTPPVLEARSWMWIPSGQSGGGYAQLGVWFFDGPGCTGGQVASHGQQLDLVGPWTEVVLSIPSEHLVAPSVRVWVVNQKVGAGTFQVYADHLWLGPPLVFEDGFEHGSTGMWSNTLPHCDRVEGPGLPVP